MDPISRISQVGGGVPALTGFLGGGSAAAQRCCASAVGGPPMGMDALMSLVQMQGQMTAALLRIVMELLEGKAGGGASGGGTGTPGGGTGAGAGAGQASAAGGSTEVPAEAKKWLTGDVQGLDSELLSKLAQVGQRLGKKLTISSGFRSRQEQEVLYQKYLNGTGNLAAKPGTSNHESGNAADVQVDGQNLASNPQAKRIALELGLHFPVPGEPWHVELR